MLKQKIKKLIVIMVVMSVLSLICLFHAWINPFIINEMMNRFNFVTSEGNLLVHFINVDQADAVAINLPDEKIMLIDNGSKDFNVSYSNYIKENVVNSKTEKQIDYLVLTHADADHVGGTMKLLKNFDVKKVFMPKIISDSQTFQEIYDFINKNYEYETLGEEFSIGNNRYKFTFFESLNDTNTNDSSQVIKLEYKNKSFLFAGDISSRVEDDYVNFYGNELDCDVLKVAHHGSSSATSQEFLNCVTPKYAVISVGTNSYGHPTDEVLNRLSGVNAEILRTDKHGDILFVHGDDYNFEVLTGDYYITNLTFDCRIYILIIDVVLFGVTIFVVVKKEKEKK